MSAPIQPEISSVDNGLSVNGLPLVSVDTLAMLELVLVQFQHRTLAIEGIRDAGALYRLISNEAAPSPTAPTHAQVGGAARLAIPSSSSDPSS